LALWRYGALAPLALALCTFKLSLDGMAHAASFHLWKKILKPWDLNP